MKRLPQFVTLLALVALSVSLAYWAMQLFKAPQRPINPPPVPVVQDASVEAGASLFGGQVSVAAAASNYQLKGVVASGNGRGSVAIIATDGQPAKAYPTGAEVAPGVRVQEVQARYVLLQDGGVSKRIELATDDKALALPAVMPSPAATPTPAPVQAPATSLVPPPLPMEAQRPPVTVAPAGQVMTGQPPNNPPAN